MHDWQLYNTVEDPFEQANYVFNERFRDQKERCHRLLSEWIERTDDEFPLPDIALNERGTPAEHWQRVLEARGSG